MNCVPTSVHLVEEGRFLYDTDAGVGAADGHVGRQYRPAVRLRVVHLHRDTDIGTKDKETRDIGTRD